MIKRVFCRKGIHYTRYSLIYVVHLRGYCSDLRNLNLKFILIHAVSDYDNHGSENLFAKVLIDPVVIHPLNGFK